MTKPFTNLTNLTIVLTISIFIPLGCKDSSKTSSNVKETKAIGGSVFPASEVCSYPKGTVLDKYGSFNQKWEQTNFNSKELEAKNSNLLYSCKPSEETIKITDTINDIEVKISYSALGSRAEGAYRISIDYWISSNTVIPFKADQKLRKETLIPFCNNISKKALKTSLSKSIVAKLQNVEKIGSPTGTTAKPACEKLAQGFVCIAENISQSDNLLDFKIFASEESYQSYLNGGG